MGRKEGRKNLAGVFAFLKNRWMALVLLLAAASLVAGCANDEAQMKADIDELQNQTYTLQTQVSNMSAGFHESQKKFSSKNETELHTIRSSQTDVLDQLSAMHNGLDSLRGSVDTEKHRDERFFSDQSSQIAALEKRLDQQQAILNSLGGQVARLQTGMQAQAKAAQPAAVLTPQSAYDNAYASYQGGKYSDARKEFGAFLKKFPDDPLAGNAQFWIAQSYFKQKSYDQAILAYEKVIKRYPRDVKVPEALLQQGISFLKTHDPKVAKALFRQVIEKYPRSRQARLAKGLLKKTKVKRSRRG